MSNYHPSEDPSKNIILAVVVSLVVHFFGLLFVLQRPILNSDDGLRKESISVQLPSSAFREVVESLQENAKEEPKDARFASDRNLNTLKETSPDKSLTNVPRLGGGGAKSKSAAQKSAGPTIMSFSQADILKEQKNQAEALRAGPKGPASAGFRERLERGVELKLNARFFDYGSYINRMRNKIGQRWEPQKTITPSMYQLREVRVDVAVVLSSSGEIVEVNTLNSSRFSGYDDEVLRALRESAPYPNPPKSLIQDDGLIYMPWSFVLTMDPWGAGSNQGIE